VGTASAGRETRRVESGGAQERGENVPRTFVRGVVLVACNVRLLVRARCVKSRSRVRARIGSLQRTDSRSGLRSFYRGGEGEDVTSGTAKRDSVFKPEKKNPYVLPEAGGR
jgi:hypothetical protein